MATSEYTLLTQATLNLNSDTPTTVCYYNYGIVDAVFVKETNGKVTVTLTLEECNEFFGKRRLV